MNHSDDKSPHHSSNTVPHRRHVNWHEAAACYPDQITTASAAMKGGQTMVSEGLLNLFGTSSAEIITNTKKESEAQINELTEANKQLSVSIKQLSASNRQLSSQNDYLKELLRQDNISFE